MTRRPSIPITCTLDGDRAAAQLDEWAALRNVLIDSMPVPGGVRMAFPADRADAVRDLARREAACCAFLELTVAAEDDTVSVTVTSEDPQARPVIELLAGG